MLPAGRSHLSHTAGLVDPLTAWRNSRDHGTAVALCRRVMTEADGNLKRCAVLVVNCSGRETAHSQALLQRGFRVVETAEWPADDVVLEYEVVILVLREMDSVSIVAARMRAKPRFGHRVFIGVTSAPPSGAERRHAILAGFDDVVGESHDSRVLIARILKCLRSRPEHRCLLPERKRHAA
jgi:DNA-binding response OmpR family regulator